MLTLNYNVFADMLFNRFNIFFDVILEEDHVMMLLPHMLKSGRDNPRPAILQKHSAILHAILQHVTYNELNNLSDSMDRRTSITIRLCELALKRLTDVTFTEVRPGPARGHIPRFNSGTAGHAVRSVRSCQFPLSVWLSKSVLHRIGRHRRRQCKCCFAQLLMCVCI